jgi:hypothetical protein
MPDQKPQPASRSDVEKLLRRIFKAGELRHLPRSRRDTERFIALAVSALDPRAEYTEAEVNELLIEWMAGFTDPATLDHVTIRRYLVDYSLLLRDSEGARYRTNQAVLATFIEADARSILPQDIFAEVQRERVVRRRANLAERN